MWSYVRSKANPRWLWHAIDHHTGKVLAYVFGQRKDEVFLRLQELLKPFGITKFYTDGWGAYERHLDAEQHRVGKENTQKIEVLWYLPEYKIVIISITYANMSLSQNIERASNSAQDL